jgi:hypothetical protein
MRGQIQVLGNRPTRYCIPGARCSFATPLGRIGNRTPRKGAALSTLRVGPTIGYPFRQRQSLGIKQTGISQFGDAMKSLPAYSAVATTLNGAQSTSNNHKMSFPTCPFLEPRWITALPKSNPQPARLLGRQLQVRALRRRVENAIAIGMREPSSNAKGVVLIVGAIFLAEGAAPQRWMDSTTADWCSGISHPSNGQKNARAPRRWRTNLSHGIPACVDLATCPCPSN